MLVIPGVFKGNTFILEKQLSVPDGTKASLTLDDKAVSFSTEQTMHASNSQKTSDKLYYIGIDITGYKFNRDEANER
ncbi:hypothetical protein AGMMS49546_14080 [Spirochaetia bacterium]|nr:hypothetical protein AGMMS49546_14080 [Spirochaetia bacterium]